MAEQYEPLNGSLQHQLTNHLMVCYDPIMGLSAIASWATPLRVHAGRLMGSVVSFEEEEPKTGKTVRLPVVTWNEIAQALEFEQNLRRTGKLKGRFSLNDLLVQFARWSLDQYWAENGPKPDKMTDRDALLRALNARLRAASGEGGKKK